MRSFLRKPIYVKVKDFVEWVIAINKLLTLFHDPSSKVVVNKIPNHKILDLLESVMHYSWQRHMVLQCLEPIDWTIAYLVDFCEQLEATEESPGTIIGKTKTAKDSKKPGQALNLKKREISEKDKRKAKCYCMMHGPKDSHNTEDFFTLKNGSRKTNQVPEPRGPQSLMRWMQFSTTWTNMYDCKRKSREIKPQLNSTS